MTAVSQDSATTDRIALGMGAAAASVLMLSIMNVFAKLLSDTHHVVEVAFYRNVIALIPFAAVIFLMGRRDLLKVNSKPFALVARSIVGTVSLAATFATFALLPMADGQAILFTASLFVPILGYFLLSEKVGPYRWGAVLVGFIGVLVMVRPSGDLNLLGFGMGMAAALMHATLGTLLRLLGRTENPVTVTFYFLLIGAVLTMLAMPFIAVMPRQEEIPLFLGLGLSGAAAQYLLSTAFKFAPAALVTIFNYTGIVWATLFGWFVWSDWPDTRIWIGAAVIITSSLVIVWREQKRARQVTPVPPGPAVPK